MISQEVKGVEEIKEINEEEEPDTFLVDNIFTMGNMPIYVEEMGRHQSAIPQPRKQVEHNDSSDSFENVKQPNIAEMIEAGKLIGFLLSLNKFDANSKYLYTKLE